MSSIPRLNRQFANWFDSGRIHDALSGVGDCFVADSTHRSSHDSLLAMQTLIQWACYHGTKVETHNQLCDLLSELEMRNDYARLRNLLLAYDVASKDLDMGLGLDMDSWTSRLADVMMSNLLVLRQNELDVKSLKTLSQRWPAMESVVRAIHDP